MTALCTRRFRYREPEFSGIHLLPWKDEPRGSPLLLPRQASDGDRLQRLSLFTECLVLFDLFFISIYKVVVSDIHEFRFVHGIIMDGRVVGVQHLILLELRIRNRNRRNQRMRVWVQREVKQLLCIRNLYDRK